MQYPLKERINIMKINKFNQKLLNKFKLYKIKSQKL